MKKSIFIALFLIPFSVIAQQGQFNNQNSYEVGIDYNTSYNITDSADIGVITKVRWTFGGTYGNTVLGHIGQQTNDYLYEVTFSNPIHVSTFNSGSNEIAFMFGDLALSSEKIEIEITYIDTSSAMNTKQLIDDEWFIVNPPVSVPPISGK